jgi:hypothetical protein
VLAPGHRRRPSNVELQQRLLADVRALELFRERLNPGAAPGFSRSAALAGSPASSSERSRSV